MDKTYETYEFLPANSSEPDADQFFVVQDDGTFLLNRQIQYVAQVQDVKEVLEDVQPCTVYGVSSQQFFVDVDNSAELISVSDQFVIPDGDSSLYANSYLLQSSSSNINDQIEENVVVDQYKEPISQDIDIVTYNSKQGNNFTEITLSDEQYHTLEQKGWILLESNDKIFVLNTLGLHDITTNDKLIQKLKNELQNSSNTGMETGPLKIESVSSHFPNIVAEPLINQQETVEFVINNDDEQNDTIEKIEFVVENKDSIETLVSAKENLEIINETQEQEQPKPNTLETFKQETIGNNNSIKIKTKFNFKDIPDKILLGKTLNGKRLVAKVIKPKQPEPKQIDFMQIENDQQQYNNNVLGLLEADFVNLVQMTLRAGVQTKFNQEDITSAETVVSQLLRVPNLKESIIGHNLIVTKVTKNKDLYGAIYDKSKVSLVTGRVVKQGDDCRFEHLPNLLHSIKSNAEEQKKSVKDEPITSIEETNEMDNFTIFHVHVSETTCIDNVVRVSVNLNKRQLPMSLMFGLKRRYPSTVFACSACAALFKSEEALTEHQITQCMDTDDMLTIDIDKLNKAEDDIIILNNGKDTIFSCGQCDIKHAAFSDMQEHVKMHHNLSQQMSETGKQSSNNSSDTETKNSKIYKCKMCPNAYFHSSTLSKHIMNSHIKVKKN